MFNSNKNFLVIISIFILFSFVNCSSSVYDLEKENFKVLKNPVTKIEHSPKNLLHDRKKIEKELEPCFLAKPPIYYNGLTPKYPMLVVLFYENKKIEGITRSGGFSKVTKCLLIRDNGKYILIDSKKKVNEYFLPINNKLEALSYLTLVTNSIPIYDFKFIKSDFRINRPILNKTYVDSLSDGYFVHLFEHQVFYCVHPYREITYKVDSLGNYEIIKSEDLFFDPKEDGRCVD